MRTHVSGSPDVIVDIASPSTSLEDRREKMELYDRSGVVEYFIIDPDAGFIEKDMSIDGKYGRAEIYAREAAFLIDTISLEQEHRTSSPNNSNNQPILAEISVREPFMKMPNV